METMLQIITDHSVTLIVFMAIVTLILLGIYSRRIREEFSIHNEFSKKQKIIFAVIPFILLVSLYLSVSHYRLSQNPDDKIMPSIARMADAVNSFAFKEDVRSGKHLLWNDTVTSLQRMGIGLGLATICGLLVGINLAMVPLAGATLNPFIIFLSIIPPLSILPILFVIFGGDTEEGKIALIFIGTFFLIARDIQLAVEKIPRERVIKALTLGASQFQVIYQIVLPQVFPRLLDAIRNNIGPAWLFLLAAEAIAADSGLGYRIFLVRRNLRMDIIIPYVLWITFLGYSIDYFLRVIMKWKFSWYLETK